MDRPQFASQFTYQWLPGLFPICSYIRHVVTRCCVHSCRHKTTRGHPEVCSLFQGVCMVDAYLA